MNRLLILLSGLLAVFPAAGADPQPKFRLGPATEIQEPGKKKVSAEAQALAQKAMRSFQTGDLAAARKDFQKVLLLAPGNVPVTINLGLIEYREKRYGEAEVLLKAATRSAPEAGLPWLILGVVQFEQGKLDAALAALAQAAYLEPKDARAHHYLGVVVGSRGWYSAAEDEMRKAIELAPDYAEAHYNLAVFYLQRVPPATELARRHYQKSLDLGGAPDLELEKKISG
jgi:Flp pilus assembly protein TadD